MAVTELWSEQPPAVRLDLLVALARTDASATAQDLAGSVALRTASSATVGDTAAAQSLRQLVSPRDRSALSLVSRRVAYIVGIPGDHAAWLAFNFSAIQSQHDGSIAIADALVDLFDAMMMTFAWVVEEEPA